MTSIETKHIEQSSRRDVLAFGIAGLCTLLTSRQHLLAEHPPLRVAGLFTVPSADRWASQIQSTAPGWASVANAAYEYWDNISPQDFGQVFQAVSAREYDLIIGDVFSAEQEARKLVDSFPTQAYLMGSAYPPLTNHPFFGTYRENYVQDAAYLAGMVAGAVTQSNVVGLVGAFPNPPTNRLMNAFLYGAREINPNIFGQVDFLNEWSNPELARQKALSQIEGGADILLADRRGVAAAASEMNVLTVGVIASEREAFPDTEITSIRWHFEPTILTALNRIRQNSFRSEDYSMFSRLEHHGCSLASLGKFQARIPDQILETIARREFELRQGSFTVANNENIPLNS